MNKIRSWKDQLWSAISFMHERGVVHRDLKPGNILVYPPFDCVRITDFGSSALFYGKEMDEWNVCTYQYASPEMLKCKPYNESVDIWSLGVILAELIMGEYAFPGDDASEVMKEHEVNLSSVRDKLPEEWRSFLNEDAHSRMTPKTFKMVRIKAYSSESYGKVEKALADVSTSPFVMSMCVRLVDKFVSNNPQKTYSDEEYRTVCIAAHVLVIKAFTCEDLVSVSNLVSNKEWFDNVECDMISYLTSEDFFEQ